jgi:GNAT superfamily N-acetyltransferase
MSHFPWMLQEKLGIAPPRARTAPRNETLTAELPATFGEVNWNHCENGNATPTAKAGVTILMGPAVTTAAGAGARYPAIGSTVLVHTANQLREGGWVVQIIPDDYVDASEVEKNKEERSAKRPKKEEEEQDPEARYIQSDSYGYAAIEIKDKSGNVVGRMANHGMDHPFLYVVSTSDILTDFALGKLGLSFAICGLKCTEFTLPCSKPGYSLSGVNGVGDDSTSPSTLVLLKFGDKTVGKALCTYHNSEMGSVGPTLELIEIAKEWRRHGLGTLLMEALEHHFEDVFLNAIEAKGSVRFAVCYVTNRYASLWFQNNFDFEDLDGMGEELGKNLMII